MFTRPQALPDLPAQKALARRFIWRASWPLALAMNGLPLLVIGIVFAPWLNKSAQMMLIPSLIGCGLASLGVITRAQRQVAAAHQQGVALTEPMIDAGAQCGFASPLDAIATFELCADRLSSIGMAAAMGLARPAAFRHNPFTGVITVGRVRPFWYAGALQVTIVQAGSTSRVQVRRLPGLARLLPTLGEALALVEKVGADLERALATRRAAMDAAVRAQALERSALQAKLHALQAQVEPHFLYNTLANLKVLIRTDGAQAATMVDHLVGYLQAALPDMRSASSTVGRESELAEHYLSLMQIRLGQRLRFRIQIDPAIHACPVPPAMLISLVENAVKHGLEPAARPGTIVVAGHQGQHWLELSVADDGAGLGDAAAGTGLGLANIHQRLQLLYGPAAALRVEPGPDGGVRATLHIPTEMPA